MKRWIFGVLALLFCSLGTAMAIAVSELRAEAGTPRIPLQWFWFGDVLMFAISIALLYFAIKPDVKTIPI